MREDALACSSGACSASARMPSIDEGGSQMPRSSIAASFSRVRATRNGMSARRIGSSGRSTSELDVVKRAEEPPERGAELDARVVRELGIEQARAREQRRTEERPREASLGRPTNRRLGDRHREQRCESWQHRSSRSTPGIAISRRGKRNAHCSSTTQTELSQPSPSRRAEAASSSRELLPEQCANERLVDGDVGIPLGHRGTLARSLAR